MIAGIDGLSSTEYAQLCEMPSCCVHELNAPNVVQPNEWINCCITWIKDPAGTVQRWVQPKIRPSLPELNTIDSDMFCGQAVDLFEGRFAENDIPFRFFSLICFDWIAAINGELVLNSILGNLDHAWRGDDAKPIHWVFVVQHNKQPNNHHFLTQAEQFLTDQQPLSVDRRWITIVMANTAAKDVPCRSPDFGCSAFIQHPNVAFYTRACKPTICFNPTRLRGTIILEHCKDNVFRESGACVHECTLPITQFAGPDVTQASLPVKVASVHPLSEELNDPRAPGSPVPAAVKWINDEFDSFVHLGTRHEELALAAETTAASTDIFNRLRTQTANRLNFWIAITIARDLANISKWRDVDVWADDERRGLNHAIDTLGLIDTSSANVDINESRFHGTLQLDNSLLEIIAMRGKHRSCIDRFKDAYPDPGRDLILIVSRDDEVSSYPRIGENFTKGQQNGISAHKFTEPYSCIIHRGFQNLFSLLQSATSPDELKGSIDACLQ